MKHLAAGIILMACLSGCFETKPDYDPGVTAADFVTGITHPFLPYKPGATWTYRDGNERIEILVLSETRNIQGVAATVVRDTVYIDDRIAEDTYDWYAQDKKGAVWYLGEDTKEYENGKAVSAEGSWEWGVDGALPGIALPANPVPDGKSYFMEFYWKEAVDEAAVIDVGRRVEVPSGTFTDTVTTKEWTRLEPGVEENAHYARGVGVVLKETTKGSGQGTGEKLVAFHVP
ncbi:MAG: hypothetical protein HYT80_08240 [Euryarchaeota archaeon]|nr:hypothetical protein [Euryarchaeota archaeon]